MGDAADCREAKSPRRRWQNPQLGAAIGEHCTHLAPGCQGLCGVDRTALAIIQPGIAARQHMLGVESLQPGQQRIQRR